MRNIIKESREDELLCYYKIAKELCQRYENSIKNYDGSIITDGETYQKYEKLSKVCLKLLDEMESRVLDL